MVATCQGCHQGATSFDINGKVNEIQGKIDTLKGLLVGANMLTCSVDEEGVESCTHVQGTYPAAKAKALWDWVTIVNEDGSKGVHNPAYTISLLDAGIATMSS